MAILSRSHHEADTEAFIHMKARPHWSCCHCCIARLVAESADVHIHHYFIPLLHDAISHHEFSERMVRRALLEGEAIVLGVMIQKIGQSRHGWSR